MSDANKPEIREDGNAIVIKLEQDQFTNSKNLNAIGDAINEQIDQARPTEAGDRRAIIIDCTDVTTLPQTVRGVLLSARRKIKREAIDNEHIHIKGKLILAGVTTEDRALMDMAKMSGEFTLTNTLEDALEIAHAPETTPESELPDAPKISENSIENKR